MRQNIGELTAKLKTEQASWLCQFIAFYQSLTPQSDFQTLASVYHENVVFIDPMHQIFGVDRLSHYFAELYQNVSYCHFEINHYFTDGDQAAVYWTMTYSHKRLNSGLPIEVQGHSFLKGEGDVVILHRDYIDLGEMLYEHLPIFGRLTKWIKSRVEVPE